MMMSPASNSLAQLLDRRLGRRRRRGPSPRRPWGRSAWRRSRPATTAPVAPSPASFLTASWLWSKTTQSCPAFISRRTMFPPIRPRPIIPSCTCPAPFRDRDRCRSDPGTSPGRPPVDCPADLGRAPWLRPPRPPGPASGLHGRARRRPGAVVSGRELQPLRSRPGSPLDLRADREPHVPRRPGQRRSSARNRCAAGPNPRPTSAGPAAASPFRSDSTGPRRTAPTPAPRAGRRAAASPRPARSATSSASGIGPAISARSSTRARTARRSRRPGQLGEHGRGPGRPGEPARRGPAARRGARGLVRPWWQAKHSYSENSGQRPRGPGPSRRPLLRATARAARRSSDGPGGDDLADRPRLRLEVGRAGRTRRPGLLVVLSPVLRDSRLVRRRTRS